jgi:hypothetical protein
LNALLWLRFFNLRLSVTALFSFLLLLLTSIPVLQNLTILQPFLLVACCIAGAALLAKSGRMFLAGVLLALATIKPQVCLLPLAWFALWIASDWRRRRSLFWGFAAAFSALLVSSDLLLPGWLIQYPHVLRAYAEYTEAKSFLDALLPSPLNWVFAALFLAAVVRLCWRERAHGADSAGFAIALCSVMTLGVLIVPALHNLFNHVLLLPVVLLVVRNWRQLRSADFATRATANVFWIFLFLPWPLAIVALARPLTSHSNGLLKLWSLPLAASMALPFAAFSFLIVLRNVVQDTVPSLATLRRS